MSRPLDDNVAREIMHAAADTAANNNNEYITSEHILSVLLTQPDVIAIMDAADVDVDSVKNALNNYFKHSIQQVRHSPRPTIAFNKTFQQASSLVAMSGRLKITATDILIGLMHFEDSNSVFILRENGLTLTKVKEIVSHGLSESEEGENPYNPGMPTSDPALTGKMTDRKAVQVLKKYTTLLNTEAREARIDPLIGRKKEVFNIIKVLQRRTKNNAILVGPAGVGKTSIAEGLAKLIEENNVPKVFEGVKVYSLDVAKMLAGAKFRGDFEERIIAVLNALDHMQKNNEKTILFIDEIHMIIGAGANSDAKAIDLSNMLKPYLSKGRLRCIGSTTEDEFRKHFEKDKALLRRFMKIDVGEPSIDDTIKILNGLAQYYEQHHNITYTPDALEAAVKLSVRYIQNRYLPDKAIDIIDSAGSHQQVIPEKERVDVIDVKQIQDEVSSISKIDISNVNDLTDNKGLKHLQVNLQSKIFGQDIAIEECVSAVQVAKAGFRTPGVPLARFLFTGPTGVGKTELSKQLARELGVHFEKIDMSEYMEEHSVSKFIGAPPGYVGYDENGGRLVNAVETNPNMVLLLDEIEKAHPSILNILLQVLGDATLTNSNGKTVKFDDVIVIMTSNAGAKQASKGSIGFNRESFDDSKQDDAIKNFFKPELLNRLDAIIKFNMLTEDHIMLVVDKFITELNLMVSDKNVSITLTNAAKKWLVDNGGFDPLNGARPMERVIHNHIKKPLSRELLFGRLEKGGAVTVTVNKDTGELSFSFRRSRVAKKESSFS